MSGKLIPGRFGASKKKQDSGKDAKRPPRTQTPQEIFDEAIELEEDNKHSQAKEKYEVLLGINPKDVDALVRLGCIYYKWGNFEMSLNYLTAALKLNDRNAFAYCMLGDVWNANNDLEASLACYKRAAMLSPNYADAYYGIAWVYDRKEARREALKHWKRYVTLQPTDPKADYARSRIKGILENDPLQIEIKNPSLKKIRKKSRRMATSKPFIVE